LFQSGVNEVTSLLCQKWKLGGKKTDKPGRHRDEKKCDHSDENYHVAVSEHGGETSKGTMRLKSKEPYGFLFKPK